MHRKILFVVCFVVSSSIRIHWNMQGRAHDALLLFPLRCMWMAFLMPMFGLVCGIERLIFRLDPWAQGQTLYTLLMIWLGAPFGWFISGARIERWFGCFDPVKGSDRPRPRILGAAVFLFEQINKRLFGRQKTGGWA